MTALADTKAAPDAAQDGLPDAIPPGGGSFVRNPDGTLTQTNNPDTAEAGQEI